MKNPLREYKSKDIEPNVSAQDCRTIAALNGIIKVFSTFFALLWLALFVIMLTYII